MSWLNISQVIILDLLLQFVITKYSLGEISQQLSPAISVHLASDISAILIYMQRNLPFLSNMTESNITLSLKCHYVVKQNSEKLTTTTTGEIVEAHLLHIFSIIFPHFVVVVFFDHFNATDFAALTYFHTLSASSSIEKTRGASGRIAKLTCQNRIPLIYFHGIEIGSIPF